MSDSEGISRLLPGGMGVRSWQCRCKLGNGNLKFVVADAVLLTQGLLGSSGCAPDQICSLVLDCFVCKYRAWKHSDWLYLSYYSTMMRCRLAIAWNFDILNKDYFCFHSNYCTQFYHMELLLILYVCGHGVCVWCQKTTLWSSFLYLYMGPGSPSHQASAASHLIDCVCA